MAIWEKLRGTIESIFQIGLSGPQIKNNAGLFEMRNDTDAAFVVTRGATPVGVNDYTTKAYVDTCVKEIQFTFGIAATTDSLTSILIGSQIITAQVEVVTPFSGGATVELGNGTVANLIQDDTDNHLQSPAGNIFSVEQNTDWGIASAPIRATVSGGPIVGSAIATVRYVETPAN